MCILICCACSYIRCIQTFYKFASDTITFFSWHVFYMYDATLSLYCLLWVRWIISVYVIFCTLSYCAKVVSQVLIGFSRNFFYGLAVTTLTIFFLSTMAFKVSCHFCLYTVVRLHINLHITHIYYYSYCTNTFFFFFF